MVVVVLLVVVFAGTLLGHAGSRIAGTVLLAGPLAGLRMPPEVVLLVRGLRYLFGGLGRLRIRAWGVLGGQLVVPRLLRVVHGRVLGCIQDVGSSDRLSCLSNSIQASFVKHL